MLEHLSMQCRKLGGVPIINRVLDTLRVDALFAQHVRGADRRARLAPSAALGVLLRNIIVARGPLYGVHE